MEQIYDFLTSDFSNRFFMSSGVAYTQQIIVQRDTAPTIASLILSLEAVVSVIAGFLLLGERLCSREVFGCILMLAAIILAQLPIKEKRGVISGVKVKFTPDITPLRD